MAHKVCLNTKNKKKVDLFETYKCEDVIYIKNLLENKNYEPGAYNIFLIHEPKVRLIMSQSIRDKIINHLVAKYFLVDVFDSSFIESNIATRKGNGTHYGLKLIKKYLNEIKKKHKDIYYLKFDIKKYFYNMDHEIVKSLIRRKIKDQNALDLLDKIIDTTDEEYVNETIKTIKKKEINGLCKMKNINSQERLRRIKEIEDIPLHHKGKGFSIGNMSSQIFGILYLNELDHFIKEELKIKYYERYMDDAVLIHHDKQYLNYCKIKIEELLTKYKLEFNIKKTYINNIKNGLDFLGFRFHIKNNKVIMKVRNSTKRRFKKKEKILYTLKRYGYISDKVYKQSLSSNIGHLISGSCKKLIHYYKIVL